MAARRSMMLRGTAMPQTMVMMIVMATLMPMVAAADGKQRRSDDVNSMAPVVEKLSQDLLAMQSQLTAQNTQIHDLENQMEAQRQEMNTQLEAQRLKIVALEAANNYTIAFSATVPEPNIQASAGSTIPFTHAITNVGDAYNPSTSIFTAPRPGQYFFIIHVDCSPDYRSIFVNVNGHPVFHADNDAGEDHHVTGSGLMTLQAGDVVSASHYTSTGFVDGGIESTFTGFWVK